jgi:hypothetical protein
MRVSVSCSVRDGENQLRNRDQAVPGCVIASSQWLAVRLPARERLKKLDPMKKPARK